MTTSRTRHSVEGMTCASCVGRVERALEHMDGVASASVNLVTRSAEVIWSGAPNPTRVRAAIEDAGATRRIGSSSMRTGWVLTTTMSDRSFQGR